MHLEKPTYSWAGTAIPKLEANSIFGWSKNFEAKTKLMNNSDATQVSVDTRNTNYA